MKPNVMVMVRFDEVFASVARIETARPVVAMASLKGCSMCQLDVKFAFLDWPLDDEMYVKTTTKI